MRAAVYSSVLEGGRAGDVAVVHGVSASTVKNWSRIAGMTFNAPRSGGGVVLVGTGAPGPVPGRRYRRLTLADRAFIEAALAGAGSWPIRRIASHLGVSASTVSREIARHRVEHGHGRHVTGKEQHYHAGVAHYQAVKARSRSRPGKLAGPVLRAAVAERLNQKWSPVQVSARLVIDFPDRPEMRVSHETIYQALYVQGKGALRHELTVQKALRSGRTSRKPRSQLPARNGRPWLEGARLSARPAQAADRAVPGHWEGDLVVGPGNSGIVTLVERRSRFALIGRLPGHRDSETVITRLQAMIGSLPGALFTTITWDQGAEMAQHKAFTVRTGCPVFFCDPHSPWQRGSNENLNGLIRDFYPKGTNFNEVTDTDLATMQHLLNTRPRKTLGFLTPSETLRNEINVAIAA
ncbi:IS30 family transposase [Microbacterium sp.]|uniref:IS30 family transposase n=1 Tax=Microbacterium sp. TaxID=51671 RepID=UPI0039E2712E